MIRVECPACGYRWWSSVDPDKCRMCGETIDLNDDEIEDADDD